MITDLFVPCVCGSKARVTKSKHGFYAHCLSCGKLFFWKNSSLTERISLGGQLCAHKLEAQPCKGGFTTWCPICRVRTFSYGKETR